MARGVASRALTTVAVLAATAAPAAATLPKDAINITVYHVNQANYTGITNMNTADGPGDAFFDMRSLSSVMDCRNASAHKFGNECTNPESVASNLVITKVIVSVSPMFGEYGECNVCENSTVPFTNPPEKCVDGTYHCRCGDFGSPSHCQAHVGKQDIREMMSGFSRFMNLNETGPPTHWMINLAERTGGTWYSTLDIGECDNPIAESCEWKLVDTIKQVNATCQAAHVKSKIESMAPKCFSGCPNPGNSTSDCYINCYYEALLGPEAAFKVPSTSGGLSGSAITGIWVDAFENCPDMLR